MSPLDLVKSSADGSMSLTKLAAATFHLILAVTVAWITYITKSFNESMWLIYASVAVGHATFDKTLAVVAAYKGRKFEVDSQPQQPPPQ